MKNTTLKRIITCVFLLHCSTWVFAEFVKDTTVNLGKGFVIKATHGERYVDEEQPKYTFTTYNSIKLIEGKKIIFSDTTSEYQLDGYLSPFFREIGTRKYEFLIEVNDRPNMNYFLHIIISSDDIIHCDTIHADIVNCPKLRCADGSFELHGFLCDDEISIEDNDTVTQYNPVLYYDFRKNGIIIDSAMTKKTNRAIYGKFEGYQCDGSVYPEKIIYKKEKELKIEE